MVRLFETRKGEGRAWWWLYACSVLLGLLLIWVYRTSNVPESGDRGRWAWVAVFAAELWFGFEWLLTLSTRWNPIHRYTFKDRLTERFDDKLPGVDVFICTADPALEPPKVVINTVLSVLAYDYPPEKLSVYLSDDGGSIFTFYALLEAMRFARLWIPFCKKFNVQPMSPALFFSKSSIPEHDPSFSELAAIKKLYKDMENRIDLVLKHGNISEEIWEEHEGFSEWSSRTTFNDHQAIIKVLIDERDKNARDNEGFPMPRFVYMAREKRPKYHHNFKAGALNALLRVSEQISNGPIILTIDCDMCANSAEAIKDALCFFMDEERGHEYAYVQFFQSFVNITRHDLYASSYNVVQKVYYPGLDGQGGPGYSGSCCFHKRECLNGKKFREPSEIGLTRDTLKLQETSTRSLEDTTKKLAACSSEDNTQWGKEMGVKYGCPLEDIITGFSIQCKGWKSAYFIPEREAFLGLAPTTLSQALIQNQRWTEGYLQILLSKYCPFVYGIGRTKLGLQVGYSICCFWAFSSVPSLIYAVIPSICFLNGISLFPTVSNFWFMPFAFVIAVTNLVSLRESLYHGETFKHWWNDCRMSLYRRTTSYLFALLNTVLTLLNITDSAFVITPKLEDEEASKRYEQEIMEFGSSSPMFTLLSTVAMLNLFCFVGGVAKAISYDGFGHFGSVFLQFLLCGSLVLINLPVYQASFFRNDRGCIPMKTTVFSVAVVIVFLAIPVW